MTAPMSPWTPITWHLRNHGSIVSWDMESMPLSSTLPYPPPAKRGGCPLTCGCPEVLAGAGYLVDLCPHAEVVQGPGHEGPHPV